jgi:hypothetical protein
MNTIQTISSLDFNFLEDLILNNLCSLEPRISPFSDSCQRNELKMAHKNSRREKTNFDRMDSSEKKGDQLHNNNTEVKPSSKIFDIDCSTIRK